MKVFVDKILKAYSYICELDKKARREKNKDHLAPSFPEIYSLSKDSASTGWFLMAPWLNIFHDDNEGLPEIKFTNIDGREYIYGPIDDKYNSIYVFRYGSFNYCSTVTNEAGWIKHLVISVKCIGHFVLDIIPSLILRA